jgi:hypothetical protein
MLNSIKIANAGGYWGDDLRQFKRQIELAPIDFVTLDFLAEITMSIMQKQRARDPRAGYARDFVQMVEEALPAIAKNGTRAISNAGGVNPLACRAALIEVAQQHGHDLQVAAIPHSPPLRPRPPLHGPSPWRGGHHASRRRRNADRCGILPWQRYAPGPHGPAACRQ